MTGAKLPDQPLDGADLIPIFKGGKSAEPRPLFWHFPAYLQSYSRTNEQRDPLYRSRPCSIIRLGDWKLHEYFEYGRDGLELYNLSNDIGEKKNLAAANPKKVRELHQLLIEWRKSTKAPVPTEPNPNYDAEAEAAAIAGKSSGKPKRKDRKKKKKNA